MYKTFRQTPVKSAHIKQLLHVTIPYGYVQRKNLHTHPHSTKVVPIMFGVAVFSLENYAYVLHVVQQ